MPERFLRGVRVVWAFFVLGYGLAISYPMSFAMNQLGIVLPVVTFYFVSKLVPGVSGASRGGDYFTFVVLGLVATNVLMAGLQSFGRELDLAVQQGRFEMLLTEPVGWKLLPIGLATWPAVWRLASSAAAILVSALLGARYQWSGLAWAVLIAVLGSVAGLSIGVLSGGIRVLSKRSDPILALYTLAGSVVGGVFFPVALIPGWLRWASFLVPQTYLAAGLRAALTPTTTFGGPSATEAVVGLACFAAVLLPLSLWLFERWLDVGRRVGVLGSY